MESNILDSLTEEELEALLEKKRLERQQEAERKRLSYENLKDETIINLCSEALHFNKILTDFKVRAFSDMETIYELLQEYSQRHKDGKGNFSIENDRFRIRFRYRLLMDFDERATQAKKHIIEFIETEYGGDDNTRDLIKNLLSSRNGELDVRDIQKLYAMENRFDNENWRIGIKLLKESFNEKETKGYIQFEERMNDGSYQPILLNFSSINI